MAEEEKADEEEVKMEKKEMKGKNPHQCRDLDWEWKRDEVVGECLPWFLFVCFLLRGNLEK
jgi:hypothetical protein